jgi:hypothetical protein
VLDSDGSGSLSTSEFCASIKKLVRHFPLPALFLSPVQQQKQYFPMKAVFYAFVFINKRKEEGRSQYLFGMQWGGAAGGRASELAHGRVTRGPGPGCEKRAERRDTAI